MIAATIIALSSKYVVFVVTTCWRDHLNRFCDDEGDLWLGIRQRQEIVEIIEVHLGLLIIDMHKHAVHHGIVTVFVTKIHAAVFIAVLAGGERTVTLVALAVFTVGESNVVVEVVTVTAHFKHFSKSMLL